MHNVNVTEDRRGAFLPACTGIVIFTSAQASVWPCAGLWASGASPGASGPLPGPLRALLAPFGPSRKGNDGSSFLQHGCCNNNNVRSVTPLSRFRAEDTYVIYVGGWVYPLSEAFRRPPVPSVASPLQDLSQPSFDLIQPSTNGRF